MQINKVFAVFPRSPEDQMIEVPPKPSDPKQVWYVEQWHKAKGYTQPLPFASGSTVSPLLPKLGRSSFMTGATMHKMAGSSCAH